MVVVVGASRGPERARERGKRNELKIDRWIERERKS